MIKVLIVDDEPLVQVGVKSILNWQEMNMEVCGTASNGQAALSLIEEHSPEIVITDIKMPVMSGLELIKACREKYGNEKPCFIILTSYEDFHLAKEALNLKASDYLLKLEMNADTLRAALEKVVKQLPSSDALLSPAGNVQFYYEKFFIRLLHNLFESEEQFELQSKELGLNTDRAGYLCCYGEICSTNADSMSMEKQVSLFSSSLQMIRELSVKYLPSYVISLDMRHFAILFCYDSMPDSLEQIPSILFNISQSLEKYYNVSLQCGIGNLTDSHKTISDSFQFARQAFQSANERHPIATIDEGHMSDLPHPSFNISIFKKDLTVSFEEYDSDLLVQTIQEICDLFNSHPDAYLQALDAASNILYLAISLIQDGENCVAGLYADYPDGYRSLYKQSNVQQITGWLSTFAARLCTLFEEHKKDHKNYLVTQVKKYAQTHVKERLSLNEVAATFAVSPSYLSRLFSKHNDCGFVEYVNSCKMKEAKKYLAEGTLKVYEIADVLGFESAFYFSKVFKRMEGISPTDYQNGRR